MEFSFLNNSSLLCRNSQYYLFHTCIDILKSMSNNSYFCSFCKFVSIAYFFSFNLFSCCVLVNSYCVVNIIFEKSFDKIILGLEYYHLSSERIYAWLSYVSRDTNTWNYLFSFRHWDSLKLSCSLLVSNILLFPWPDAYFQLFQPKESWFIRPTPYILAHPYVGELYTPIRVQ